MELQPSSPHSDSTADGELSDSDPSCVGVNASPHPEQPDSQLVNMTAVDCGDRWQVYFRLQELEIPCQCRSYQPLLVDIQSAQSLVQVWSVVKRVSASRSDLSEWLNQCLRLPSAQLDF